MDTVITTAAIQKLVAANQDKITKSIPKAAKALWTKSQVHFGKAFETYLAQAAAKQRMAKTLLNNDNPRDLYEFYVPGDLGKRPQGYSRPHQHERIHPSNINNVLAVSNFLVIQGSGGMGKSTLMRHLFLDAIKRSGLIPVFLELRELNKKPGGLTELLCAMMNQLGFELTWDSLIPALKAGRFLFLLDGYDEVSDDKSQALLDEIEALCDSYPKNHFILFSRPDRDFIRLQRFTVLECLPFTKAQAVALASKIEFNEELRANFIRDLKQTLYTKHKSFASNPLLLNMMLRTYSNYAEIPEKLHIFYEKAFETMYAHHDAYKGLRREQHSGLHADEFKNVFAALCYRSYIRSQLQFNEKELVTLLQSCYHQSFNAKGMAHDLEKVVCVLHQDGDIFEFTHRSFQEYFTAYFIKERNDREQTDICLKILERKQQSTKHDSVFLLLRDMMPERYERNILIPILERLEDNISPSGDRYRQMLSQCVSNVSFIMEAYDNTPPDDVRLYASFTSPSVSLLFSYLYAKHPHRYLAPADHPYTKIVFRTMQKRHNKTSAILLEHRKHISDILKQPMLYDCIEQSWLGERIHTISTLLAHLKEKHEGTHAQLTRELEDLAVF